MISFLIPTRRSRPRSKFLLERNRIMVEGAGAASLAAALLLKDRLSGRRVALIVSAGNLAIAQLKSVLEG